VKRRRFSGGWKIAIMEVIMFKHYARVAVNFQRLRTA
jgi:hypothetical protein